MYKIGIKHGKWRIITDGQYVLQAEEDVRHYSNPPDIKVKSNGERYIARGDGTNRISLLDISKNDFENYCTSRGMIVRGKVTAGEKAKKISGPAAIGGIFGTVVGGPVGAVVGAGIAGWFASDSEFTTEVIENAFIRAMSNCITWKKFDKNSASVESEKQIIYQKKSEDKWYRFHKLKLLSGIDNLDGLEFEAAIAGLYERRGYVVNITKASGDYGVDIIAKKGNEIIAIQAKRYSGKVGVKAVQEVSSGGAYYKANKTIVITNSFFTDPAKELAKNIGVTLINKKRLANMWRSYTQETSIPPFNMQEFERKKTEIERELYRVDVAAGKKYNKRYMR